MGENYWQGGEGGGGGVGRRHATKTWQNLNMGKINFKIQDIFLVKSL